MNNSTINMNNINIIIDGTKRTDRVNKAKHYESKNDFKFHCIIGKGGFGKVWKVSVPKLNNAKFAIKELSKLKIYDKDNMGNIEREKEILSILHNDFIVNMYAAFQDSVNLYLLMDYLAGGDLRYHLYKQRKFSEEQTRLDYIHSKQIIHRDIKPENLVLDENGYVRITDFGIAKCSITKTETERGGTLGYMAPELFNGYHYSYTCDFFSLGVVCFELVFGYRPYYARTVNDFMEQISKKPIIVNKSHLPNNYNEEICNFINSLLEENSDRRLGVNGINELKDHPWFDNFKWDKLKEKTMTSPFSILSFENYDRNLCEFSELIGNKTKERYEHYIKDETYLNAFKNYTFIYQEYPRIIKKNPKIINTERKVTFRSPAKANSKSLSLTTCHQKSIKRCTSDSHCKLPLLTSQRKMNLILSQPALSKRPFDIIKIKSQSKLIKSINFRSPSITNNRLSQLNSFLTKVASYKKLHSISKVIKIPLKVTNSIL